MDAGGRVSHHKTRPTEPHWKLGEIAEVPRENCERPEKVAYASRAAARRARKRVQKGKEKLSAYLCGCGSWHLGRLAPKVTSGQHERWRRT
jgi:hypothetical protein